MIIYLHGFNSTGKSAKGRFLKENLQSIPVLTPTYHYDPQLARIYLENLIEYHLRREPRLMLAGASLGGFYAQYLAHRFRLKTVLINPALMPLTTLHKYLGENTNFYTGETYSLTQRHLDALLELDVPSPCVESVPTLLLVDKGDEVIDYHTAVTHYRDCAQIMMFEDGDHQFQHMTKSLSAIQTFYNT